VKVYCVMCHREMQRVPIAFQFDEKLKTVKTEMTDHKGRTRWTCEADPVSVIVEPGGEDGQANTPK